MLTEIAEQLDRWVAKENVLAAELGSPCFEPSRVRVLGQTALFEAELPLPLALTRDVDVYADFAYPVRREFERLLAQRGKELDPLGHELWMPGDTRYTTLFSGPHVRLEVAEPDAVLVSKALKAPAKNGVLIREYLAQGASARFLKLCERHAVDLELFL